MLPFFVWVAFVCLNATSITDLISSLQWDEIALPNELSSMSTVLDTNGNIYLCGGKVSLYGKSSKCIRIEIRQTMTNNGIQFEISSSANKNIKAAGPFPGIFFNAKAFTAETQNEGGMLGNRMCMLSISDGTNKPKCWCCDVSESKNIECDDLQYTIRGGCPNRFEGCVAHDPNKNVIYQIGGYYGESIFDTILCFDLETETYLKGDDCPFGKLVEPLYGAGCAVMQDSGTIVVVGGLNELATTTSTSFSPSIDVCKSDGSNCKRLTSLNLNEGIFKTRVFSIDSCHVAVAGGKMKKDGFEEIGGDVEIVNICSIERIDRLSLPRPMSEAGIIKTKDALCLYGGVSYADNTFTPQLSKYAYCTSLGSAPASSITLSPTTKIPTYAPTTLPTELPTHYPSVSPTQTTDVTIIGGQTDVEKQSLLECQQISVETRDFSFKAVYDKYREISNYLIFATHDQFAYLVIDTTGVQNTWIYNYTEKTSCYYYSDDGTIVDIGPGLWIKPRTRYAQTQKILITLSCTDFNAAFKSSPHRANGILVNGKLSESALITVIVMSSLIVITALVLAYFCWTKKTRFREEYGYKKDMNIVKMQDSTDEDEDDDDEDKKEICRKQGALSKSGYVKTRSYSSLIPPPHTPLTIVRHDTSKTKEKDEIEIEVEVYDECRHQNGRPAAMSVSFDNDAGHADIHCHQHLHQ